MIQIYSAGNSNFTKNGDAVLHPIAATVSAEINGSWRATLEHPADASGIWEYITEQAVIKMPFYNGDQLFRIYRVTKLDYSVQALAYPIFFDSANDCFLVDVRPTNRTGQQALNIMMESNSKYSGFSNIMKTATAYYEYKNLMEALSGAKNSFLNRWGGEIEYDNFHIVINERIGADNGLEFRYGKNLNGIQQQIDTSNVVTRLYPKAYNGRKLSTGGGYVDSGYISNYPTIRTKVMEFPEIVLAADATPDMLESGSFTICEDQSGLDAALISACMEQFTEGQIDVPDVTITLQNVVDLSAVEGYEGLAEPIHLGDTVHLYHEILGIRQSARIVALTYDAICECVAALTIGKPEVNYFNQLSSAMNKVNLAINSDGTLKGENLVGLLDLSKANLYQMYDVAEVSDKPAILFENLDESSPLYGAMGIGTRGFMIADTKNAAGEWIWSTWGTARGLVATAIVTGILSDKYGNNYWNLDTGDFSLMSGANLGGKTIQEWIDEAQAGAVEGLTQQDIFNILTNYGKAKGIFMQDGELYINATYLASGFISSSLIEADSISVDKLTGRISTSGWMIDLENGTLTIGNISADKINAGTLNVDRIASNSVAIDKLTGEITNGNWAIDLTNGTLTIGNISAGNITTGTLAADRIAANSIAVSKLTGSIANGNWKIDLDAGTFTIGTINAGAITSGTIDAARIGTGTITATKIADGSVTNAKLATAVKNTINGANSEEQLIYISKASATSTVTVPTSWVTRTSDSQNTWTTKRPTYSSSYPVLFVATQRKDVGGTITCTTPLVDDTTTVIDGGHITTGTIDAGTVNVTNINASNINAGTLSASRIASNSIGVGKLSGSISKDGWVLDLTNGTLTIGLLSANQITSGEMSANRISGGTLTLGGSDDGNGTILVLDSSSNTLMRVNNKGIISRSSVNFVGQCELDIAGAVLSAYREVGSSLVKLWAVDASMGTSPWQDNDYWAWFNNESNVSGSSYPTIRFGGYYYRRTTTGATSLSNYRNYFAENTYFNRAVNVHGNFTVDGTKSRIVNTENYGNRLLYAYETPSPLFGDVGEGQLGEDGLAYVWLDPIFAETISTAQYQVFLQKYGAGDCWIKERRESCFIVEGTPGLSFGWELKAKQADFDQRRLETENVYTPESDDYGELAAKYLTELQEGRIA